MCLLRCLLLCVTFLTEQCALIMQVIDSYTSSFLSLCLSFLFCIFSLCLSYLCIFIQHLFCLCSISSVFYLCIFDAAFLLSIFVFVSLYLLYFNFFLSKLYIQFSLFCLSVFLFGQVLNVMRGSVETVNKKSWESSSNQIGIILWVVDAAKH